MRAKIRETNGRFVALWSCRTIQELALCERSSLTGGSACQKQIWSRTQLKRYPCLQMQPSELSEFAPRVSVLAPSGRLLFVIHAARAAQMVERPEQILKTKGGLVREIVVAETAPKTNEPSSPAGLAAYMGQRYTRIERLVNDDGEFDGGRVHQFKPIHPGDRDLFVLSVTDNLSPQPGAA